MGAASSAHALQVDCLAGTLPNPPYTTANTPFTLYSELSFDLVDVSIGGYATMATIATNLTAGGQQYQWVGGPYAATLNPTLPPRHFITHSAPFGEYLLVAQAELGVTYFGYFLALWEDTCNPVQGLIT